VGEIIRSEYERVMSTEEKLHEEEEPVAQDVAIPVSTHIPSRDDLVREARNWWVLPDTYTGLEKLAQTWGRNAQCLIELREELRRNGLLYPGLERDIAREIRAERAKLYMVGLKVLSMAGNCSQVPSQLLRKLCEYASTAPPKYVWEIITRGTSGARRPDIILSYMCRYKRECC